VFFIFHFLLAAGVFQKSRPAEESRKVLIRLDRAIIRASTSGLMLLRYS
jgi:hypothetical protein